MLFDYKVSACNMLMRPVNALQSFLLESKVLALNGQGMQHLSLHHSRAFEKPQVPCSVHLQVTAAVTVLIPIFAPVCAAQCCWAPSSPHACTCL